MYTNRLLFYVWLINFDRLVCILEVGYICIIDVYIIVESSKK